MDEFMEEMNPMEFPEDGEQQEMEVAPIGGDFYENLADKLEPRFRTKLGIQLKEAFERDMDSREAWKSKLSEGLKVLGLSTREESSKTIGLSQNYNSSYLKTWLRISAEITEQLIPVTQFADTKIRGESSELLEALAKLARDDINDKILEDWEDIIPELESAIQWTIISGKLILKVYYDPYEQRPFIHIIPPEDVVVDNQAKTISTAERISHLFTLTERQYRMYQASGFYSSIASIRSMNAGDYDGEDDQVQDVVLDFTGGEKRGDATYSFEKTYRLAETEIYLSLDDINDSYVNTYQSPNLEKEGKSIPIPYTCVFSPEDGKIVRFSRNWEKESQSFKRLNNYFDFSFIPGFSFWSYGLAHLAAGLAQSASTIQRTLIDAGIISNFPGGLRTKGIRFDNNDLTIRRFEWTEVDTNGADIRAAFSPLPVTPPSSVLFELLQGIERDIQEIGGISTLKVEDLNANTAASAILAVIEQQSTPRSAVLKRFQRSINNMLKIVQRIFFTDMWDLPVPYAPQELHGITYNQLYSAPIRLISAADTSVSSMGARLLRAQSILEMAQQAPEMYNMHEIHKRTLSIMGIVDIDKVLLTEEQLQQQQQEQQEQAAKAIDPNQLLMEDIELKKQSAIQKHEYDLMKLEKDTLYEKEKMNLERLRLELEIERSRQEDQFKLYKLRLESFLKKVDIEIKNGIPLPSIDEIEQTEFQPFQEFPSEVEQELKADRYNQQMEAQYMQEMQQQQHLQDQEAMQEQMLQQQMMQGQEGQEGMQDPNQQGQEMDPMMQQQMMQQGMPQGGEQIPPEMQYPQGQM